MTARTNEVTRRNVAKGAAWSIPAVTMGLPSAAIAASGTCAYSTAVWNTSTSMTSTGGSTTATASPGGVTITTSTVRNGSTNLRTAYAAGEGNFNTASVSVSERAGSGWLVLSQDRNNAAGQTVTVTFSQPVYCVSFYVNDIDTQFYGSTSKYRDNVTVPGFTAVAGPGGTSVLASGSTATSATTATSTGTSADYNWQTDARGLAMFTNAATSGLTSFTLTYTNTNAGTGTNAGNNKQEVYISPLRFSTTPCNCA